MIQNSFKKFAKNPCMGTRKFLGMHKTDAMRFPIKKFGPTSWQTYAEVEERSKNFGRGLKALGMESLGPDQDDPEKYQQATGAHTMLLYEETCAQWMTAMLGAHSQSLVVATSYSTLGISAVIEAVNETGCAVIVCNLANLEKVKAAAGDAPSLKAIVYSTNYVVDEDIPEDKPLEEGTGVKVLSVDQVIALGASNEGIDYTPPTPTMPAVVMYTSGSTGKPKGVMIPHKSIAASVSGILGILSNVPGMPEGKQTYLAYLPAAHILELCAEFTHFAYGSAVGYADPKAIASSGACRVMPNGEISEDPFDKEYPHGGIAEFKPTMFAAVPKIWDVLKKGIEAKLGELPGPVQFLFQVAFAARYNALKTGRNTPLLNLLFKKFYNIIGGRMKLAVTGGGPCSAEVQSFVRTALMVPLVQGYALTETTCAGCIQTPDDPRDGVVGAPLSCIEMRLVSQPDVNDRQGKPYMNTDTRHAGAPCLGRGEVQIRGAAVSAGYYKMPDKTKEEFDSEGWFHTGDVGVWTTDGSLKIVDRIKNLVKLLGGEYIAVEAMEAAFATSVYVDGVAGGVMVYGDGTMDKAVAIVQASPAVKAWARAEGMAGDMDEICNNPATIKMVLDDLNSCGKVANLGNNEKLAAVHLISGLGSPDEKELNSPWTPENNFLTASNKLNRKVVEMGLEAILTPLKAKGTR